MAVGSVANEIEAIAGIYEFREPDEVRVFLTRYPFVLPLLEETRPAIDQFFGASAQGVFLQTVYDVEEQHESLAIRIQVNVDVDNAAVCLRRFYEGWWSNRSDEFFGVVQAGLEFGLRVRT